jgi:hypothetical protein
MNITVLKRRGAKWVSTFRKGSNEVRAKTCNEVRTKSTFEKVEQNTFRKPRVLR